MRHNNLQVYDKLRNNKTIVMCSGEALPIPGVEPCQVRESSRAPRASLYRAPHKLLLMHKKLYFKNYKLVLQNDIYEQNIPRGN